ncbi:MAG: dihydropteroate synthase [Lachnospiraceae bacterium]|nr:dihydropteroate synthase [Lachnospiraceae bacterium]
MRIGNAQFDTENEVYIMGILNVTPDSFSDGGRFESPDAALFQTEKMLKEGASIIDVGGESTRPGSRSVSAQEEMERVVPVIRAIRERFDTVISLDTCKPAVAAEGLKAGAELINDIAGLRYEDDTTMAAVIAGAGAACVIMHNTGRADMRGGVQDVKTSEEKSSVTDSVISELGISLRIAEKAGIRKDGIIIDPGIGFGKDTRQNLELIANADRLQELGYPVLMAASRKTVIGQVLDLDVSERLEGTIAVTTASVLKGCAFIRVHDVKENYRAAKMALALRKA